MLHTEFTKEAATSQGREQPTRTAIDDDKEFERLEREPAVIPGCPSLFSFGATMSRYFKLLVVPIVAAVVNFLLSPLYGLLPHSGGEIVFNIVRVFVWLYAGWRLASLGRFGTWKSALSGAVLFFIDHPILKGGYFLVEREFMAFGGVIVSYCMFCFVPVALSGIGAAIGKRQSTEPAGAANSR